MNKVEQNKQIREKQIDVEQVERAVLDETLSSSLILDAIDIKTILLPVKRTKFSVTPLYLAAQWGKTRSVSELLERGVDVSAGLYGVKGSWRGSSSESPLHIACKRSQSAVVALLIEHGAPIDAFDRPGHTPLRYAIEAHCVDAVRLLLNAGCKTFFGTYGEFGYMRCALGYARDQYKRTFCDSSGLIWSSVDLANSVESTRGAELSKIVKIFKLILIRDAKDVEPKLREHMYRGICKSYLFCHSGPLLQLLQAADDKAPSLHFVRVEGLRYYCIGVSDGLDREWEARYRRMIQRKRWRLFVRESVSQMTIALQPLEFPAFVLLKIANRLFPLARSVPLHLKWNTICTIKHWNS